VELTPDSRTASPSTSYEVDEGARVHRKRQSEQSSRLESPSSITGDEEEEVRVELDYASDSLTIVPGDDRAGTAVEAASLPSRPTSVFDVPE
jgi:hypothetical protein